MGVKSTLNRIRAAGFCVVEKSKSRILVTGGLRTLSYFPLGRNPSVYVQGSARGYKFEPGQSHSEVMIGFLETGKFPGGLKGDRRPNRVESYQLKSALYQRSRNCRWCRKSLRIDEATLDHVIPISQGGSNRIENLVLACGACNQSRKNSALPLSGCK